MTQEPYWCSAPTRQPSTRSCQRTPIIPCRAFPLSPSVLGIPSWARELTDMDVDRLNLYRALQRYHIDPACPLGSPAVAEHGEAVGRWGRRSEGHRASRPTREACVNPKPPPPSHLHPAPSAR